MVAFQVERVVEISSYPQVGSSYTKNDKREGRMVEIWLFKNLTKRDFGWCVWADHDSHQAGISVSLVN